MNDIRNIPATRGDRIFNASVKWLAKMGVSLMGTRLLAVRGRKTGEWRTTAVNVLTYEGEQYLVAPRGHTQWVRNMRVAGGGELRLGWRKRSFTAVELADADKPGVFRLYLKKWAWEVGRFFGPDVSAESSDEKLLEIAPDFPVFRLTVG
ncbi:nitroreductase/quinone reductase family protein [Actinocrispum wychmicini]|uniref:Deazaflavin-dependent oxidoreductase (Nitroreductase family) n=1 Tax=Actinocrispum wychmicini TaxID=1213861 RepID=A0A4R2J9Y8_9PSEU|nr:nitroreductase/quinone reductase family protein [Actinocrispum wychmicini]TCO53496.1 deazaflavin-dependent oxidoreductase (nitroreductase family) [Actinocrispum wychmicini]